MYRSSSNTTTAEWCTTIINKNSYLFYCKLHSQSSIKPSQIQGNWTQKMSILLLLFFFPFTHTQLKTIGCIQILCTSNNRLLYYQKCSFSSLELHASYNCRVTVLNTHRSLFPIYHFVRTDIHNLKTMGRIWTFYILNNCSTTGDVPFLG